MPGPSQFRRSTNHPSPQLRQIIKQEEAKAKAKGAADDSDGGCEELTEVGVELNVI
jgi:hypothetical protein